ncbi:MAG: class I SAM-dependent methyltransferase [Solirubrobacterales bacterium]
MTQTTVPDPTETAAFADQVFASLANCYGGVMTSIGHRLGLYAALAGAGPLTSVELAERSGCAERYVREWLNSQVAAGYLEYDPEATSYELPAERAAVLADRESPNFMTPAFDVVASLWLDEEKTIEAFRSGGGVAWGEHDERLFCGVAAFFRNGYRANLVPEWLPALEGVLAKLEAGARVADIGCGHGHSTVLMAEAFPHSSFFGFDVHAGSIEEARRNAADVGVEDRATFLAETGAEFEQKDFDLVCFFDCLHDMGDPVGAARHAREALAEGGSVMLVEPRAGDSVEENTGPIGHLYYAASTSLCCAHAISEGGTALGAQAGEARLREVFAEAGFSHWRRAAETPFNLVLEARV